MAKVRVKPGQKSFSFGYRNTDGSKTVYHIGDSYLEVPDSVAEFINLNQGAFSPIEHEPIGKRASRKL